MYHTACLLQAAGQGGVHKKGNQSKRALCIRCGSGKKGRQRASRGKRLPPRRRPGTKQV